MQSKRKRSERKTCSPRTDYQRDLLSDGSLIESCSKQMMMVVAVAMTRIMKKMAIFFFFFFLISREEWRRGNSSNCGLNGGRCRKSQRHEDDMNNTRSSKIKPEALSLH